MSEAFTNEAFTLLSLGIAVVVCRLAARIRTVGVKKLDYDDYLMCLVTVLLIRPSRRLGTVRN